MLVFKPTYNMDAIAREVRKELCAKITDRLSARAIRELEQDRLTEVQNSSEVTIDTISTSELECTKRSESQFTKGA